MSEEMGKVLKETRGDVQEAIDVFEYGGRRTQTIWTYHAQ